MMPVDAGKTCRQAKTPQPVRRLITTMLTSYPNKDREMAGAC
jgi:hypothetical protein